MQVLVDLLDVGGVGRVGDRVGHVYPLATETVFFSCKVERCLRVVRARSPLHVGRPAVAVGV
eukprot:6003795-Pyramimonas_sp.AAC.1